MGLRVLFKAWELIQKTPREELEEEHTLEEILPEIYKRKIDWDIIKLDEHIYEIKGRILDDVLKKYVFTGDEGVITFLQIMRSLGMEKELEKTGVEEGDTIIIADYEFEYIL